MGQARKTLGLLIADTYADARSARFAVERTLRELPLQECLLLSDRCFVDGAQHVAIDPLDGLRGYNALMLDRLAAFTRCDAYLVVQWDGFAIDGRRWWDGFLDYDYVGAPWHHLGGVVGAGGFSLRSRRLIESVQRLRERESVVDVDTAEDLQICLRHRPGLEAAGLRFAAPEVAAAFAFERPAGASERAPSFGFHGAFNLPLVLGEAELLEQLDALLPRMRPVAPAWLLFVRHAWQRGYHAVCTRASAYLSEGSPRVWAQVVQAALREGVPAHWLRE
jgi:hypothetical protein